MLPSMISGDALAEMQSRLNALSRSQAIAEFDTEGFVYTANLNYLRIMGFSSIEDIKGWHHSTFCDPKLVKSDGYSQFWDDLKRGVLHAGVYKRFRSDGKAVWLQASYNPIIDTNGAVVRIIKFASDITEQKVRDIEAEGQLRAIAKSQAMIEFGVDGRILTANENYCNAMGYRLEEIVGQHHRLFCEPDYAVSQEYRDFWEKLKRGEFVAGEFKRLARDGHVVFIEASYNPIVDSDGQVIRIVKFATDVTKRRMMEAQNAELEARARAASQASELKSSFLATVSHELRTPLGGIIGLTYLLKDSADLKASQLHVQQIYDCAEGLLSIVNDILDLSKIEAGKMQFERRAFDLRKEVEAVCDTNRPAISKRGLSLHLAIADALPPIVQGDALRIRQVLNNLVSNAIKFSDAGDLHVIVEVEAIKPEPSPTAQVIFKVRDQGKGIRPDDITKLFVPFSQVDSTIARRFGGTGLGLSISRALVDGMGGSIGVTSEEGRGSEFWFRLPLMIASRPEPRNFAPSDFVRIRGNVLLVEDNAVNQTVLVFMLKKMGLEVIVAANGKIALDTLRESYDLVIMDCQMPEMDGFEATRKIRQREKALHQQAVPIIALTANAMPGEREKCLREGMDSYLSKPVVFDKLYKVLVQYLTPNSTAQTP